MKKLIFLVFIVSIHYSVHVRAQDTTVNDAHNLVSAQDITEAAEQYIRGQLNENNGRIEVAAHRLDPRAPERHCEQPLTVELANNQNLDRQATVQVACADNINNWRMYVPVRIARLQQVLVATRTLSNGHVISANDFEMREVDTQQLRGSTYTDLSTIIGARLKRRVQASEALQARDMCFVCRGEQVTIISAIGNLRIEATGRAQQDAVLGETISVINTRSERRIQGRVSGTGQVTINQ
ncbi:MULTISPECIES: flagellar basal body P-ring formation chaperone FlgA [Gammaproteobacteria]|uniref:flagellar basal body P-ring formation chaperone FlgA n=1 Tax=Gammaproteobacteria TaxID=1236 RepID=UPI000DD0BB0D|nr:MULTISPECIES: flagellar basal body P-ring formation chaperone FlgA [Gammaproteobacteria]RTE86168.1 flagellar basal body P-ring formation protein FlgA [Aliidiomarina sp. B3213]TCZ91519.1 flagellar basal body P-ring formation protein FlgA [Lysobacter sp. N42]